ncbi:MAG: hypothetical protein HAW67_02690, partial [Endozoicomonadaceae bacterium]|nr:hypothetical protein [Endozoicomonadaceae bacterium]
MQENIEKYREDLKNLTSKGDNLHIAMQYECYPNEVEDKLGKNAKKIKNLLIFNEDYQSWYSETKVLIKQLLPDR